MKNIACLLACLTLLLAGVAHAETVTVHWTNVSPNEIISINAPTIPYNGGVYAGMNNFSISGGSGFYAGTYKGYCVDPSYEQPDFQAMVIPVTDGSRYEAAAYLFGKYYSETSVNSLKAAEVQEAVWELVWDFGNYNLATGNFQTGAHTTEVNALIAEATGALANFTPTGYYVAVSPVPTTTANGYYGVSPQDFMFRQVPEPGALLMLGAGLLGIVLARKRKK